MKKIIYGILVVALFLGAYILYSGFDPQNNGMNEFSQFNALAQKNGVRCNYSGFVYVRKEKRTEVYATCDKDIEFQKEIESQDELKIILNENIVQPNLSSAPSQEDISIVVIVIIKEDFVLCTATQKGKIIDSWFDSYENYCLPQ